MLWDTFAIADLGCNGAMFTGRIGSSGPEILTPPNCWKWGTRKAWGRRARRSSTTHGEDVENRWRLLVRDYQPVVVAFEKPKSIMGRKHIGISQSYFLGRFALIAQGEAPSATIIQVPGQYGEARVKAWAIMRPSFAEIIPPEELRKLSRIDEGEPGEHVADACAIFLAAIPRWDAIRKTGGGA